MNIYNNAGKCKLLSFCRFTMYSNLHNDSYYCRWILVDLRAVKMSHNGSYYHPYRSQVRRIWRNIVSEWHFRCIGNTGVTFPNALPRKLTPPSICSNQLYYKVTPRVIVSWLPNHFATTGLHCKMTPHFEMTPNKQYYTSYAENN